MCAPAGRNGDAGPKWEGGRLAGGDKRRANRDRKIFSFGSGFTSLRRGVPVRNYRSDRGQIKW